MPKKRKSRGRSKGDKGKSARVQCDLCGAWIPRDKAIKVTKPVSLLEPQLAKDLMKQGAQIYRRVVTKNYCVKCAISKRVVKVRAKDERRQAESLS
ncbi:MAG: 30S ribosomal protein S26e [Candidatus Verstraetearchaeota archaeon]|nr:30S ribosomal protein S26e [Candidatus Verstraetearchaeota archaeon]